MVNVMVNSYAHAEAMGIKPVDSIISVAGTGVVFVKKAKPPYRIVGYGESYTFRKGQVTFAPNLKEYIAEIPGSEYDITLHAISPAVARMMMKHYLRAGVRYKLYEKKTSVRRV